MNLVMFDIDGTLTETMKVEEECFVRSCRDVFGFADIDTDWSHYPRTTDSGIFHDVFTSRVGRLPTPQEVSRFRQQFIYLLAAASSQPPFAPVAGADRLLFLLAAHRIVCRSPPEVGVIPPASRWLGPGCVLTTIRQPLQMTHSTGNPL